MVNLIEFAFGLNPEVSDAGSLPQAQLDGNELIYSFVLPPGVSDITYRAESSETLAPGSWQPVPNTGTAPQIEFRISMDTPANRFMRLIVSDP